MTLSRHLRKRPTGYVPLTTHELQRVADIFTGAYVADGFTRDQLLAKTRTPNVCTVRQEVMTALWYAGLRQTEIARIVQRDHATVMHGIKRVESCEQRTQRARDLSRTNRRDELPRLVVAALPDLSTYDVAAIQEYLRVCVLGEPNYHRLSGAIFAWAIGLLRQGNRATRIGAVLSACGLEQGAAYLGLLMARGQRRAS